MPDPLSRFARGRLADRFSPKFATRELPDFRRRVGLQPSDRLDVVAVDALRFAPSRIGALRLPLAPARLPLSRVAQPVERALRSLRLPAAPLGTGPHALQDQVRAFQRSRSLPDDGDLGPEDFIELSMALSTAGEEAAAREVADAATAADPETFSHAVRWPELRRGEQGSLAVEFVQLRINELSLLAPPSGAAAPIDVDGDFGPGTEGALVRLQSAAGLPADGVVSEATWLHLVAGVPTFRKGATAEVLKIGQRRLKELNYGDLSGSGSFGDKTLAALHSFQVESGLAPSDEINADTWRYLFGSGAVATPVDVLAAARAELTSRVQAGLPLVPVTEQARVSAVLAAAIASYGIREKPEGSNRGPEVDALVGKRGLPWCALSVSSWLKRGLGATSWSDIPFGAEVASVNAIRAWGVSHGRFLPREGVPPGAILVMNRRTGTATPPTQAFDIGHTGLVVEDRGATVVTIEGNSQDSVRSNERDKSTMVGFVRWWA